MHQSAGRLQAPLCQRGRHHQGQRSRKPRRVAASRRAGLQRGRGAHGQGHSPPRWRAHQVRRQRRRAAQQQAGADRHPHLRPGHARAAHRAFHEDRVPGAQKFSWAVANKIRTGDEVIVITGRDKGKRGKVLRRADEQRVVVEGSTWSRSTCAPARSRACPAASSRRPCPSTSPTSRSSTPVTEQGRPRGHQGVADGKEVRVYKSSGEEIKVA